MQGKENLPGLEPWGMQAMCVPDWEVEGGEAACQAESLVTILAEELRSEPLALLTHSDQRAKSKALPSRVHKLNL